MGKFIEQYENLWGKLKGEGRAHQRAVGGDFEVMGTLEFQLLRLYGLKPQSSVVDVGCGSGRLAAQLAPWLKGPYLGTDILPALLDHARQLCNRSDWSFVATAGQDIPAPDNSADFICFFSVLTHITHEESWRYIQESKRVLKPGGKLICSFLEFHIYSHWAAFEQSAKGQSPSGVLNQFLSRDAFASFAHHAGLKLETFMDGDKANIPIERELVYENGVKVANFGVLGQSVCVMEKPLIPLPPAA